MFGDSPNVIWIAGGDCRGDDEKKVWELMGTVLKQKTPEKLVGYHPFGRTSSSYWFQDAQWLDFHMFQSGHRRTEQKNLSSWDENVSEEPWHGEESFRYVQADYDKTPIRPILDGEPSYEQIPQGLHNPEEPYWQDHHVRRYAYWSVLAGAAGHVYGHNAIIQFYGTGGEPQYGAKEIWEKSIHDIGSSQMSVLKELMEASDFSCSYPAQHILADPTGKTQDDNLIVIANGKRIICYSFNGREIVFNDTINGMYDAYWLDPISGFRSYFGSFKISQAEFMPPNKKYSWNDWILVLEKLE